MDAAKMRDIKSNDMGKLLFTYFNSKKGATPTAAFLEVFKEVAESAKSDKTPPMTDKQDTGLV